MFENSSNDSVEEVNEKKFKFDLHFQEKILQAMLIDRIWAGQFQEVLNVDYFQYNHIKLMAQLYLEHYKKYRDFPSFELFKGIVKDSLQNDDNINLLQDVKRFLKDAVTNKDLSDLPRVKEEALEFCKIIALKQALEKSVDLVKTEKRETIIDLLKQAISAGISDTAGLELDNDVEIEARYSETQRRVVPTGIEELDQKRILNGGLGAGELGIVAAPTGCHARGTLLPQYNGILKKVEDIKVGDKLLGPDGKPRTVLKLIRGTEQMYEIAPIKGESFVVNEGHILSLVKTSDASKTQNKVIEISVKDYVEKSNNFKHLHKLYRPEAFEFECEKSELHLDPYILGLFLGDGCLTNKRTQVTTMDKEIIDELKIFAEKNNLGISEHKHHTSPASSWYFTNAGKHGNKIIKILSEMGLNETKSGTKFIPHDYKISSANERLQILAGLLDTDGSLDGSKTCFDYVTKSAKLADDVVFVCHSLGLAATKNTKFVSGNEYFRITISGNTDKIPTKISRKKPTKRMQIKSPLRTGFKILKKGVDEYFGFTLSGDHLYLNEDFIVNHNCGKSHLLVQFGAAALKNKKNVLHYTFELSERMVGIRYDSNLLQIDSLDCYDHKEKIKEYYKDNTKNLGRLRIKYYPTSSITVNTIKAHMDKLAQQQFRPDLIIIDYIGIMRSTQRHELMRLEMKKVCEEVRCLASELDIPVWTALQSNKEGAQAEYVGVTNMAESYSQAHVADVILGLSRKEKQKSTGVASLFIAKNRAGVDGILYPCHIDTSRSTLRILTPEEKLNLEDKDEQEDSLKIIREKFRSITKT